MTADPIGTRGSRTSFAALPGGGYGYELVDELVRFEMRFLRRDRGQLHAQMTVRCFWADPPTKRHDGDVLASAWMNLSSQTARRTTATYCRERAKTKAEDFDWPGYVDSACILANEAEQHGEPAFVLDDAPVVTVRDHDVNGLILPADAAAMIVAPGDSLKSMIKMYVGGTLAQRDIPVLYLDWEWSADRHRERKRRLFGAGRLDTLHYRRCRAPLTVELDSIRRYCDANAIAHIAVDSVGLAADGPLNEDETARRFHQALALLPPALCGAHVPKSSIGADIKADPHAFGSVYFENLCRMCWAVKKQPRDDENEVSVGLFRTKQNDGERAPAVGWTFTFTPAHITVTRTDLATVAGLADRLPVAQRIAEALKRGPMSYAELATALEAKKDTIIKAATRANGFTKVLSRDGIQRLALVERRPA